VLPRAAFWPTHTDPNRVASPARPARPDPFRRGGGVNRRIFAALLRVAAFGCLLMPAAAAAQLRCTSDTDREIRRVSFTGNASFTADQLTEHIVATPTDLSKRIFRIGTRRCLQPGLLAGDVLRLKSFYIDQGFPSVRVDTTVTTQGKWVDILFRIQEG